MKTLQEFYNDKETKENVHEYLVQFLRDEIIDLALEGKDVSGAVLAKSSIDKAFENMELLFPPKVEGREIINEAR